MGYVFGKAFWWILAGIALGFLAGWLWNGWWRRRWVDQSEARANSISASEVERLRNRVANLEPIVADRDALRERVGALEGELQAASTARVQSFAGVPTSDHDSVVAERDRLASRVAELEGSLGEREAALASCSERVAGLEAQLATATPVDRFAGVSYDLAAAQAALGEKVVVDDLKLVEGIGPKIEELCHASGVTTWAGLADTSVDRLREILAGGGDRFRMHDPTSWPRQAELLALGRWEDFKQLTDQLNAGR